MILLTDNAMQKVDDAKRKDMKNHGYKYGLGINAHNGMGGAGIYLNDAVRICDLEDLEQLIDELTMVRTALISEVGIIC